jgi:hypothetical protein
MKLKAALFCCYVPINVLPQLLWHNMGTTSNGQLASRWTEYILQGPELCAAGKETFYRYNCIYKVVSTARQLYALNDLFWGNCVLSHDSQHSTPSWTDRYHSGYAIPPPPHVAIASSVQEQPKCTPTLCSCKLRVCTVQSHMQLNGAHSAVFNRLCKYKLLVFCRTQQFVISL